MFIPDYTELPQPGRMPNKVYFTQNTAYCAPFKRSTTYCIYILYYLYFFKFMSDSGLCLHMKMKCSIF